MIDEALHIIGLAITIAGICAAGAAVFVVAVIIGDDIPPLWRSLKTIPAGQWLVGLGLILLAWAPLILFG